MHKIRNAAFLATAIIAVTGAYGLLTPSITHSFTITIDRPLIYVFTTLADARQLPNWVRSLEHVQPVGRSLFPGMPASTYELKYSKALLDASYRLDIVTIDPVSTVSTRMHNGSAIFEGYIHLRPKGSSTELDVMMTAKGASFLTRAILPLARWRLASETEENFQRFKAYVERDRD